MDHDIDNLQPDLMSELERKMASLGGTFSQFGCRKRTVSEINAAVKREIESRDIQLNK